MFLVLLGCFIGLCLCLAIIFWCSVQGRPGGDLLSRGLSRSTIGAGGFHFRVRDGIGWIFPRHSHQAVLEQNGGFLKRAVVALFLEGFVLPGVAVFRLHLCICFNNSASTDVFSRLSVCVCPLPFLMNVMRGNKAVITAVCDDVI